MNETVIGLKRDDPDADWLTASLLPGHAAPDPNRTVRRIRWQQQLDALKKLWGTDTVVWDRSAEEFDLPVLRRAWTRTRVQPSTGLRGGEIGQRGQVVPDGPCHAAVPGAETAICGAGPIVERGHDWPQPSSNCEACAAMVRED